VNSSKKEHKTIKIKGETSQTKCSKLHVATERNGDSETEYFVSNVMNYVVVNSGRDPRMLCEFAMVLLTGLTSAKWTQAITHTRWKLFIHF
jgi:hypothetical protein